MTFKQLKDIVALKAGVVGNPLYPDVRLGLYVNLAQRWVQTQLIAVDRKRFEGNKALTDLTGGTGYILPTTLSSVISCYAIPSDLLEVSDSILSLTLSYRETVDETEVVSFTATEIKDADSFREIVKNQYLKPTVNHPIYYRGANEIYLSPNAGYYDLQGTPVIYNLYAGASFVTYLKYLLDMTADNTTCELPLDAQNQLIEKAVEDILADLGNIPAGQKVQITRQDLQTGIQADLASAVKTESRLQ